MSAGRYEASPPAGQATYGGSRDAGGAFPGIAPLQEGVQPVQQQLSGQSPVFNYGPIPTTKTTSAIKISGGVNQPLVEIISE